MTRKLVAAGAVALGVAVAGSAAAQDLYAQASAKAAGDAAASDSGSGEDDPSGVKVFWKDGKTHIQMKNAEVMISHRFQFLFQYDEPDSSVRLPGTEQRGQGKGEFRIRRAKTTFEGWFWKPELYYQVQLSWAGPEEGVTTQTPLEDLYINWDASRKGTFEIRFGQYKVPFGRQQMTTSSRLQFVDRSLLAGEFTPGRDIGIEFLGLVAGKKLEYHAGIFNGNAASRNANDNGKFRYVARLSFQPLGEVPYAECDFETKDKPLLALAAQVQNNNLYGATAALGPNGPTDLNTTSLGGDLVFLYRGLSVFGEYYHRNRKPETGATFHSDGYNLQAGYFLKRNKVEVAFRYAAWDPTDLVAGDDLSEVGGSLNYYVLEQRLKFQADFRELKDRSRGQTSHELRIHSYLTF
jgi:phosphate-selective porin OprO and OprP